MTRPIELNRDEAELLVDLLTLTDHHLAEDLRIEIRKQWGMAPLGMQLAASGLTLDQLRQRIRDQLLASQ